MDVTIPQRENRISRRRKGISADRSGAWALRHSGPVTIIGFSPAANRV